MGWLMDARTCAGSRWLTSISSIHPTHSPWAAPDDRHDDSASLFLSSRYAMFVLVLDCMMTSFWFRFRFWSGFGVCWGSGFWDAFFSTGNEWCFLFSCLYCVSSIDIITCLCTCSLHKSILAFIILSITAEVNLGISTVSHLRSSPGAALRLL